MQSAVIAKVAQSFMDKDEVRPAQAQSYLELMPQVQPILAGLNITNAHGTGAGLPPSVRKHLNAVMQDLPKSHIWVKGLVATYLAVNGTAARNYQDRPTV